MNDTAPPDLAVPNTRRRLICMIYEAFLLFGVAFFASWLYLYVVTRPYPASRPFMGLWVFAVLGVYFAWPWRRGGQTLAMKTWRIRLVRRDGAPVTWGQAVGRYFLVWMWVLPALFVDYWFGLKGWASLAVIAAGVAVWGLLARLDPQRQFLHDRWLGTRLVSVPPQPAKRR
jgi:uncharacterized RDD family membrane protein YckC